MGLSLRLKRVVRHKSYQERLPKYVAKDPSEVWSMDFMTDSLFDGRKPRTLVVDQYSRECLAIHVGQRLTGEDVVQVMRQVAFMRGHQNSSKPTMAQSFFLEPRINGPMCAK